MGAVQIFGSEAYVAKNIAGFTGAATGGAIAGAAVGRVLNILSTKIVTSNLKLICNFESFVMEKTFKDVFYKFESRQISNP